MVLNFFNMYVHMLVNMMKIHKVVMKDDDEIWFDEGDGIW